MPSPSRRDDATRKLKHGVARRAPDQQARMVLAGADRDAFLDSVLHPPEPADKLIAALRRHRSLMG